MTAAITLLLLSLPATLWLIDHMAGRRHMFWSLLRLHCIEEAYQPTASTVEIDGRYLRGLYSHQWDLDQLMRDLREQGHKVYPSDARLPTVRKLVIKIARI